MHFEMFSSPPWPVVHIDASSSHLTPAVTTKNVSRQMQTSGAESPPAKNCSLGHWLEARTKTYLGSSSSLCLLDACLWAEH